MVLLVEEAVRRLGVNEAVLVQLESLRGRGVREGRRKEGSQFSPALSAIDSRPVSTGHRRSLCAFVPQCVAVCESREQCQQVKERAVNVPSSDSLSSF